MSAPARGARRAWRWVASLAPKRATLGADVIAALPGAIGSVPDGMASGVLAGVSPIHGLYASFAGPIGGGLTVSTKLMVVTTTSAAALAAGSAIHGVSSAHRPAALALLTLLSGVAMALAGIVRLGRYTRFVSHSVMTGFLTGVAVNIVLGQLPDLVGASVSGQFALAKAVNLVVHHLGDVQLASLATGGGALLILAGAQRTPVRNFAALLALLVPTLVLVLVGDHSVARVSDAGAIPAGIPAPALPALGQLSPAIVTGALAVAVIVLVQGAGVRESAPSPDGEASSVDGDFVGQGVGNLLSGFFRGQPVGGSVGQTALSVAAGARTRWATILSGVWMLLILLAFSGLVGRVPTPTLAAVLIYAALGALRPSQLSTILRTSNVSRIALVVTFIATLLVSVAVAVGIGVALSLVLQLNREAIDLRVTQLERLDGGRLRELDPPAHLAPNAVTMLDVHGSLLFAGARTLQARLPDPTGTAHPAVVLRLRGRVSLGATFMVVITDYADRLKQAGGRLFLSGVDTDLIDRLKRTHTAQMHGADITIIAAEPVLGASTIDAYDAAEEWLRNIEPDARPRGTTKK